MSHSCRPDDAAKNAARIAADKVAALIPESSGKVIFKRWKQSLLSSAGTKNENENGGFKFEL
jgi:hypothetical protein